MFGSIWNGIKNFGSNVIEYGVDFVKGKVEDVKNIAHTAFDVVVDTVEVAECAITGGDVEAEWKDLCKNLDNNLKETVIDYGANKLNNLSNFAEIITDGTQDVLNVADAVYKPDEDNFQSIDKTLGTISNIEDLVASGHDNIEPLKDFFGNVFNVIGPQLTKENIAEALSEAKKQDGFGNQIKTFGIEILQDAAIEAVNNAIQTKPNKTISDSEISNTKEFNGLTNKEMLLLNNLSYSGVANINNKGKTLGEVSSEIKERVKKIGEETGAEGLFDENGNVTAEGIKALDTYKGETKDLKYKVGTTDYETFASIVNDMSNKEELSSLTILDNTDIPENGINATTYGKLDENGKLVGNATVVFQGTIGDAGWQDNAKSLTQTDTSMQKAAYEYIERQEYILKDISQNPEDIHLTVSGHSKGGNLAMYSTIENSKEKSSNLTIDNCLSFDGEGFNNDYVEENKALIEKNKSKITSINAYVDPVNLLLNDIAGKTYYVGVDYTRLQTDENGNVVIDELSDFKDFIWDAHSTSNMYREINNNKNGEWALYDKCEIASSIDDISNNIEDMKEPIKSYIVKCLVSIFGEDKEVEKAKTATTVCTLGEYKLTLAKTEDGYNVCDQESGNIVAKYDADGNLVSGCIGPYAKDSESVLENQIKKNIRIIEQGYRAGH